MTFVWVLALIGSIPGGVTLLSVAAQTGAPQQAAVAAIAVALAVIPYCFARAVSELSRLNRRGKTPTTPPAKSAGDDLSYG